jgi:hypothetical protein
MILAAQTLTVPALRVEHTGLAFTTNLPALVNPEIVLSVARVVELTRRAHPLRVTLFRSTFLL